MPQQRVPSEDEITNIITSWYSDEDWSSDEENAETPLGSSNSSSTGTAFLAVDSSEDESDGDSSVVTSTCAQNDTSADISGKNGSLWTSSKPALTGRTAMHNIFTATPGVPRSVSCSIKSPYDAWKIFIHDLILKLIAKFTTDEVLQCGDSLTLNELESFIALQYPRGVYGKKHPVEFLWSQKYGISILGETLPQNKDLLKY